MFGVGDSVGEAGWGRVALRICRDVISRSEEESDGGEDEHIPAGEYGLRILSRSRTFATLGIFSSPPSPLYVQPFHTSALSSLSAHETHPWA